MVSTLPGSITPGGSLSTCGTATIEPSRIVEPRRQVVVYRPETKRKAGSPGWRKYAAGWGMTSQNRQTYSGASATLSTRVNGSLGSTLSGRGAHFGSSALSNAVDLPDIRRALQRAEIPGTFITAVHLPGGWRVTGLCHVCWAGATASWTPRPLRLRRPAVASLRDILYQIDVNR